jgi:hypothetical protein
MAHHCPISTCTADNVADEKLMCYPHWKMVPKSLARPVYAAWDNGEGAGTPEHREACRAAVDHVNALCADKEKEPDHA